MMRQSIVTRIIFLFLIFATIGSCSSVKTNNLESGVIQLKSGMISGVLLDSTTNLRVFKGIPYAAPPVGELRWKAPQPVQKWDSILACDTYRNWCPQKIRNDKIKLSEDCLCLNVWSNNIDGDEKLPVMVWIHGGGLNALSSHYNNTLDGDQFAEKGVVVVSINYRLGQLGFLAHPALSSESENKVSGNYGFLDQLEALKWVQENIEEFGGDPDNVTIFGESAGALSVSVLCASPLSKGLFHKAIMQSPWMFGFISKIAKPNITRLREPLANVESAEELGTKWANKYVNDGEDVLEKLRALDAIQVIKDEPYYETRVTIDGWLLQDYPEAVFAKGEQMDIPVIIGTNKNEGTAFWNYVTAKTQQEFTEVLTDFYGGGATEVAGFYPSTSAEETKASASQFVTDSWFLEPADHLVQGMENVTSPTYQYEFTIPSRRWPNIGATHGLEIRYVFDNLNEDAAGVDKVAAKSMINYWSQFAKTGDPNQPGLPRWEPYTKDKKSYIELGEEIMLKEEVPCMACDLIREKKIKAYN